MHVGKVTLLVPSVALCRRVSDTGNKRRDWRLRSTQGTDAEHAEKPDAVATGG